MKKTMPKRKQELDNPPKKKRKISDFFDKSNENNETKQKKNEIVFILAHGAGTTSQHPNIKNWENKLSKLGNVITFDFKKPYNKMDKLVNTYQIIIDKTIKQYPNKTIVLIGTSMGSRVSIHLANNNGLSS